jgi:hypothetical protein
MKGRTQKKLLTSIRMWRPSFTYFEEHEVGSKAFTVPVPPLVLGGGPPVDRYK